MQTEQPDLDSGLDAAEVAAYLVKHPEFFVQHQDVLPSLQIPHETGAAISLIEKQVSVLRGKCGFLESSLRDFIAVARENESLHLRLHNLIQDVISTPSLGSTLNLLQSRLCSDFHADDVHLTLIATPRRTSQRKRATPQDTHAAANTADQTGLNEELLAMGQVQIVGATDRHLKLFKPLFNNKTTVCGMPSGQQLDFLVGDDHDRIKSAALIPLHHERRLGLMLLSSSDEHRFAHGKGVMFLNQLGELLSRRIHSYGAVSRAA